MEWLHKSSLREETASFDEAISGVCYYFMRLPRRFAPRNDDSGIHAIMPARNDEYLTKKLQLLYRLAIPYQA
ncbi:hypothetical protein H6P87_00575 [Rickettsia tillamookensis]|uniref:Uncharacterized protein n=1 Tax=Rickettsia tillamookensis TaxID=2761623 RepID=A0A9E6MHU3_9RICK|nr:hypothetical protein H6P87_00575 [Rickettsia tillamookensis]